MLSARVSRFSDLVQDLGGMLAEPRGGAWRCHWLAAVHDRGTHAGNFTVLGSGACELEPHAAMDHLRIGKDLIELVDRTGWNADCLELVEEIGALHTPGQCRELADQLVAVCKTAGVVE